MMTKKRLYALDQANALRELTQHYLGHCTNYFKRLDAHEARMLSEEEWLADEWAQKELRKFHGR